MTAYSAHVDSFARDRLPPREQWPVLLLDRPEFQYPARLNAAVELLDLAAARGLGDKVALHAASGSMTYRQLMETANRIAHVLVRDLGLVPGNRVLLRAPNNPMMVACWFAVLKAGGIAVATMPLLRAREIAVLLERAQVTHALCDHRLLADMHEAMRAQPMCRHLLAFGAPSAPGSLEALAAGKPTDFPAVDTAANDVALIAFTSGTTGKPKGTMHFHRDLLAICDAFPRSTLKAAPDEVFIGTPPLAFTFGLGGLVLFPMRVGASAVLLEQAPPDALLDAIQQHRVTTLFTSPTGYRQLLAKLPHHDIASLRKCVSAGETLPQPTYEAWRKATGIRIIDGIGATEMLHIFISASGDDIRPGATGRPIPGYQAKVIGDDGEELPPGTVGRLAVRGPTGCRYLDDPRQQSYVQNGWNVTGDAYRMDADGYFWFQARADDMIVSSGYNISGPEVEEALLEHAAVAECACVAAPDEERGMIVKAYVVPAPGHAPSDDLARALQEFVKARIAPYKYPRAVAFVPALPKTETGKVQRFKLREAAASPAAPGTPGVAA